MYLCVFINIMMESYRICKKEESSKLTFAKHFKCKWKLIDFHNQKFYLQKSEKVRGRHAR